MLTYEQIVAILCRAGAQYGNGYPITACAEFIHSVQSSDPRLTEAFMKYMADKVGYQPTQEVTV